MPHLSAPIGTTQLCRRAEAIGWGPYRPRRGLAGQFWDLVTSLKRRNIIRSGPCCTALAHRVIAAIFVWVMSAVSGRNAGCSRLSEHSLSCFLLTPTD